MPGELSRQSSRDLLERLRDTERRACVCVEAASVVYDDRKATPYAVSGCIVGVPHYIDSDGFHLLGLSFQTQVQWDDVLAAWPREDAPTPCPNCGNDG